MEGGAVELVRFVVSASSLNLVGTRPEPFDTGLSREDAGYVLDTFPIVRRQDEAEFGSYRTRDLILAYMNALAAGDADTVVSV